MSRVEDGRPREHETLLDYTLRVSDRARRVRLVMRREGLEVVIPRGFDRRRIPGLLQEKRGWIERAAGDVERQRRRLVEEPPQLPDRIELPAVKEAWQVEYRPKSVGGSVTGGKGVTQRVREARDCRLVVNGDTKDFEGCRKALCRWLNRRARVVLTAWLVALSQEHGLDFGKVSVRQQRTRWGSCSRKGDISLNARLLLLPAEAAEYVMLHELCHTRIMDHSSRFWELLESHDPKYKSHKRLVRESAKALPTWLDHEPQGFAM